MRWSPRTSRRFTRTIGPLLAVLLVAFSNPGATQAQEIWAKVVDASNDRPIRNAEVLILYSWGEIVRAGFTDHNGRVFLKVPPGGYEPYRTNEYPHDFNMNHMADWFKAIKDPDYRPAVDVEIGHRTATLCNLANLSYMLGRKLQWDPKTQTFPNDPEANHLMSRPMRDPWAGEMVV